MNVTQEQINASPIVRQLWCIQFPDSQGSGMGVVKMNKDSLSTDISPQEKEKTEYVAQFYSDYAPEEPEAFKEYQMNGILDTSIVAIAPNIYLFLEALFENKSKKLQDYHFSVYKNIDAFITSDKKIIEQFPTLVRDKPFVWTIDEDGFLTNHLDHKFLNFEDPLLAKFVALACSQYYSLSYIAMQNMMRQLGAGDFAIFGTSSNGNISAGPFSDKTRALSYEPYLEMKKLVEEMKWDIHADMLSINDTLASEY